MGPKPPDRLTTWFRDWREPLRRFLKRKRMDSADVDDIAQEVFLRLLRYERSDLVDHPQAYLFKVAANVAAEWSTRAVHRYAHSAEWVDELEAASTPESESEDMLAQRRLEQSLLAIPARAREILRLHFSEGQSYEQIGRTLGVTHRVVKRDMVRAYASLRDLLIDDDGGEAARIVPIDKGHSA